MTYTKRIAIFSVLALLLTPVHAFANEFNSNFILSDEELQDSNSMTRADVQAFLDDKGGALSSILIEDKEGKKRKVSDIITRSAKEHDINPKYLLVKLQKEQSLITATNPTQKQLDGATGYGISDGCGWSCDVYLRNKGFGKQVDAAAGIMRWYYENYETQGFIKRANQTYTISNITVKPASNATGFLYTYTPHLQGNENFWKLWQRWFEQLYPSGSLLRDPATGDVYLIDDGIKRHIKSMTALVTRFNPDYIIDIPASELARYETGTPISLPNYAILKQGTTYYLLDYDTLRPFKSGSVFRDFGYNPGEVIDVTKEDIEGYKIGKTIESATENLRGEIIRAVEDGQLYYIFDGLFRPIYDEAIAREAHGDIAIASGSVTDLEGLDMGTPVLFPNGTLIGITGNAKIYVIENGRKRHIANEEVFEGLGYNGQNIIWTNTLMSLAHKTGQPLYMEREITLPDDLEIVGQEAMNGNETIEDPKATEAERIEDLMYRAAATQTIGPIFETDVDTYLVADAETGEILAAKNIDFQRPLASLTKVMTAHEAFETELNERKIIKYNAANHKSMYHRFRIAEGEMIRTSDILDAFLVSSLNTPGRMLTESARMTTSEMLAAMNSQAKAWGLANTSFVDVSGVEVENFSTARDYLALYMNATEQSDLAAYLGKTSYKYTEVLDKDGYPDHFDSHSNKLANQSNLGFTVKHSKTGYLYEAGANLAMLVERPRDGKEFIVITMGNPDFTNRFDEPKALTQWALDKF